MLRNQLKTAWRALRRHPGYTGLNVTGLGATLAVALLVLLFTYQQWAMDRFHPDADRIVRVATQHEGTLYASAPRPLAETMRQQAVPGVAAVVRMHEDETFVSRGDTSLDVRTITAGPTLWQVFQGFRFQRGRPSQSLQAPNTAVLSAEAADALFDTRNPVGQTFDLEGETTYTVTGVLAPPPGPTHLEADVYLSAPTAASEGTAANADPQQWMRMYTRYTYVRMAEGASPAALEASVGALMQQHGPPHNIDEYTLQVESLAELRFGAAHSNEVSPRVVLPAWMFMIMGALALVGLIAAGFNYVNLTVARSLRRAKEIGVRKTMGARRGQLIAQFLGESVLTALLAGALGLVLLSIIVPGFNSLAIFNLLNIPPLDAGLLWDPLMVAGVVAVCVGTGLIAGSYPAFVLSRFRPSRAMGRGALNVKGTSRVRAGLIALQVVFTVVLLVTAATMLRQTRTIAGGDHALRTERLVAVELADVPYATFRRAACDLPNVEAVTAIDNLMLGPSNYNSSDVRSARTDVPVRTTWYRVDTSYVRTMGLPLRAALPDARAAMHAGDAVLINTAAMQALGFAAPDEALGATVTIGDPEVRTVQRTVAGVLDNFAFTGIGEVYGRGNASDDGPLMLMADASRLDHALVRARTDDVAGLRDALETTWTHRLDTAHPFNARLYDDVLRMRYGPMADMAYMTTGVAGLAILIALLGLLSLTAYQVQTRTKEIGMRKALGARVTDVVLHLSKGFVGLVVVASALAVPLAWLLNRWWLQFFSEPSALGVGLVAACTLTILGLAVLTVGSQTWRAARLDPATTLRDE
jgi:putative ABC transport system permease protein